MNPTSKNIPMSSAPFVYNDQGQIAWDKMWDAFCVLAKEGGPPHREILLQHKQNNNRSTKQYNESSDEIIRAYKLLVPYKAELIPDFVKVSLYTPNMAKWFADIINTENVECRVDKKTILLPINDDYTLKETKNIVTVLAKAFHYWKLHRSWFAKMMIHLIGQDWEEGVWS
jgi:sirohydrochlorin cobaltochelatase